MGGWYLRRSCLVTVGSRLSCHLFCLLPSALDEPPAADAAEVSRLDGETNAAGQAQHSKDSPMVVRPLVRRRSPHHPSSSRCLFGLPVLVELPTADAVEMSCHDGETTRAALVAVISDLVPAQEPCPGPFTFTRTENHGRRRRRVFVLTLERAALQSRGGITVAAALPVFFSASP